MTIIQRVPDGIVFLCAGIAIGCLLMVRRERVPCPQTADARALPVTDEQADNVVQFGNGERKAS